MSKRLEQLIAKTSSFYETSLWGYKKAQSAAEMQNANTQAVQYANEINGVGEWEPEIIRHIQHFLNEKNYAAQKLSLDGKIGNKTVAAINRFKKANGLPSNATLQQPLDAQTFALIKPHLHEVIQALFGTVENPDINYAITALKTYKSQYNYLKNNAALALNKNAPIDISKIITSAEAVYQEVVQFEKAQKDKAANSNSNQWADILQQITALRNAYRGIISELKNQQLP